MRYDRRTDNVWKYTFFAYRMLHIKGRFVVFIETQISWLSIVELKTYAHLGISR